jgi:SAM-dependent methyltransferase
MTVAKENLGFVECWNQIINPKWMRFRHLVVGNGAVHSGMAWPLFGIRPGDRVLDIGCGCGETCLEIGRMVGPAGEVLGIDCTETFLEVANAERDQENVRYQLGDAQVHELPAAHFDVAFSRFGVMFFESAVRALRNAHRALKPGGKLCLVVWRTLADNPCFGAAKEIALRHLPPPGDQAKTCGPGPFSMADEETDRDMLAAAGFTDVPVFRRQDADICIGRDLEEALDFQIQFGPSGEIVREAGDEGQRLLPAIRADLEALLRAHLRPDGIWMPSSSWAIMGRKAA